LALRYSFDPGVVCALYSALSLWGLGYPEQARQHMQDATARAQELAHPVSLALALNHAAKFHRFYREEQTVQALNQAAMGIATEQGFALWLAEGQVIRGWALIAHGEHETGSGQIRQGLATMRTVTGWLWQPYHLAVLAEMSGRTGRADEGVSLLTEALELMQTTGDRWYAAETHRLMGELLLQHIAPDVSQAETCFRQALAIAQQQHAKSWELRAAMSLSRLWQQQGKREEAYELLAPLYGWFTEGFDTADLQEAKAVLEVLAG
jgi:predicted ATPase